MLSLLEGKILCLQIELLKEIWCCFLFLKIQISSGLFLLCKFLGEQVRKRNGD